uniref:Globoside alpha-1,3-N-acetylgalactosaminyltransferase 1 (FORS blood group) n=1 Tax=Equus asinus TaxID=9793 RepID=A0A9L0KF04_EQUAS
MRRHRLAIGLGVCLLVGTVLCTLWVYVEDWLPVSYVPYYLPCPEIFNMKLQYKGEKLFQPVAQSRYPQPKLLEQRPTELLTLTPWLAPIVSEGTFNAELLQHIYQPLNLTIGLTVFAVGKYTHFVQHFLESAERFFMHGYRVCYYVFTDDPTAIPQVPLGPGRRLGIIPIQRHSRWEEISTRRMEIISQHIAKRAHQEVDYLFCVDVDMVFRNPWGPETLGDLVAAIHPGYYAVPRQQFPYERSSIPRVPLGRQEAPATQPEADPLFYTGQRHQLAEELTAEPGLPWRATPSPGASPPHRSTQLAPEEHPARPRGAPTSPQRSTHLAPMEPPCTSASPLKP